MRDAPEPYRLTFILPASMLLRVQPGRHCPCLYGCALEVGRGGLVSITGTSREQIFEQARRFFRVNAKGLPAMSVAATLQTPTRRLAAYAGAEHEGWARGGRDSWQIVVNADVAFAATPIEAQLAPLVPQPLREPQLTPFSAG